jgi:hypothetical protein
MIFDYNLTYQVLVEKFYILTCLVKMSFGELVEKYDWKKEQFKR